MREHVDRGADATAVGRVEERLPVDDPARETSTTTEPGPIASKHVRPIMPAFSVVTGASTNTIRLRAKSSSSPTGSTPSARDGGVVEPRIVTQQLAAKRPEQRQQRACQAAAPDETDGLAGEEERAAVRTFVEERLRAGADLRIPTWNVPGCGEREPERHLRDGFPEDRADPEYVDPTLEAGG